jgi:hypothetical protein
LGVAVRHDDRIDYLRADEIHALLRRSYLEGRRRDEGIGGNARDLGGGPDPDAEVEGIRVLYEADDWAVFLLQGWPNAHVRLETIHDHEGVRGVLMNPPTLRQGGFNYSWNVDTQVYGAGGIERSLGMREGIRLVPNGLLTFFGSAGPSLLGWGMHMYGQPSINPIALAELTYEFCRIYSAILRADGTDPTPSRYRIGFLGHDRPLHLTSGVDPTGANYLRELTLDADVLETVGPIDDTEHLAIVGLLLARLYGRFGMGVADIPYVDDEARSFDRDLFIRRAGVGV